MITRFLLLFQYLFFMIIPHRNYWMTYQSGQVILVKRQEKIFSSEELENNCTVLGWNTTTDRQIHVLHCHHRRKTFCLVSNSFVIISADVLWRKYRYYIFQYGKNEKAEQQTQFYWIITMYLEIAGEFLIATKSIHKVWKVVTGNLCLSTQENLWPWLSHYVTLFMFFFLLTSIWFQTLAELKYGLNLVYH